MDCRASSIINSILATYTEKHFTVVLGKVLADHRPRVQIAAEADRIGVAYRTDPRRP